MGASSHTDEDRQVNDYYATEPRAAELLLELEDFKDDIWECACGEGHLSKVFIDLGYRVLSTDLIDRGFKIAFKLFDFLNEKNLEWGVTL